MCWELVSGDGWVAEEDESEGAYLADALDKLRAVYISLTSLYLNSSLHEKSS
jgi:hypothetical protein